MSLNLDVKGALQALMGQLPEPLAAGEGFEAVVTIEGQRFCGTGSSPDRALWDLLLDIALRAPSLPATR